MKIVFTLISYLFVVQSSLSQEKEFDSIKRLISTYTTRDSIRVNLLNQLTKYYTTHDISKSKTLIIEAIAISKEIKSVKSLGDSFLNYSIYYTQSGNYNKGLIYAMKAKKIQDSIRDITGLISTNDCIARIYIHLKKTKEAIKIQLKNLNHFKNDPLNRKKAGIHFYLANAYSRSNNYSKAKFHYKKAQYIAIQTKFRTGVHIANSSLGVLENRKKKFEEAIKYLEPALKFYRENNQFANIAHTNLELAKSYANLKKINKAIVLNNKAIEIYIKQKNYKALQDAYLNQSNFYKIVKDYFNTNKFLEKYYHIKDSIFSSKTQLVVEEIQVKYDTERIKKDKDLAEQKAIVIAAQKKQYKEYFIATLVSISMLFLFFVFYFERIKIKRKAEFLSLKLKETHKRMELEKQYNNSELKSLKAQMNPHFMFNAMNSIQSLILKGNKVEAYNYLTKFASLIRENLNMSEKSFVFFEEELSLLKKYLELEKLRFRENFQYQLNGIKTFENVKIPSMIIQPFVENSIKHGLLHKESGLKIVTIDFFQEEEILKCIITDNGVGLKASKEINAKNQNKQISFSTEAIKKRLSLLRKFYKLDIGFKYVQIEKGTKVVLKIPYKTSK